METPQICRHCGELFKSKTTLRQHEAKHTRSAPYKCAICGQMNFSKSSHKLHLMRIHMAQKSHVCTNCGKSFSAYVDLKRHNDREYKNFKFKCSVCEYVCEKKSELKDHESSHSGTFNHTCKVCGKTYRHRFSLTNHCKVHKDIRITCDHCGKEFAKKSSLSKHVKCVHVAQTKTCPLCKKVLAKNYFKRHMQKTASKLNFKVEVGLSGRYNV